MTPDAATRLAIANSALSNRIELQEPFWAKIPDGAKIQRVVINVSPAERDRIVAALRAIPQEPVAWRWKDTSDDWLYIETEPTLLTTGRLNEVEPLYAGPIQSSDGDVEGHVETKTGELQDRRSALIHPEAGIKPGPSEPIAQGQREAIARVCQDKMSELYCDNRDGEIMNAGPVSYAIADAILATLPQPPVGACREALESSQNVLITIERLNTHGSVDEYDWDNGGVGDLIQKQIEVNRAALAPSAQEGETVTDGSVREGDRLGYELNEETGVGRITSHTRPDRGGDQ